MGKQISDLESSTAAENEELKATIESLQNEVHIKTSDLANQEEQISQLEGKVLQLEVMSDQTAFRELEQVVASLRKHVAKRDREHVKHVKAITELKKVIILHESEDSLNASRNQQDESKIPALERKIEKYTVDCNNL